MLLVVGVFLFQGILIEPRHLGLNLDNQLQTTNWSNVVAKSGYTNNDCRARVKNGIVFVQGQITKNSGNMDVADIADLPAGIPAPKYELILTAASAIDDTMKIRIGDNGVIGVVGTSSRSYAVLDTSYPAA